MISPLLKREEHMPIYVENVVLGGFLTIALCAGAFALSNRSQQANHTNDLATTADKIAQQVRDACAPTLAQGKNCTATLTFSKDGDGSRPVMTVTMHPSAAAP